MFKFFKKDNSQNPVKETQQTSSNKSIPVSIAAKSNVNVQIDPIDIEDSNSNIRHVKFYGLSD